VAERLRQQDLDTLQRCVAELYEVGGVEAYQRRLAHLLPALVPSDATVFTSIDVRNRRLTLDADPEVDAALGGEEGRRAFAAYMHELPLFKSYRRGDGSAAKISDFLTQRQFRRTRIYNEFYRPAGFEYHLAKGLPGPDNLVTAVAWFRKHSDFAERDRLALDVLRPHLNQSFRNAVAVTRINSELMLLRAGMETLDQGIVMLDGRGLVLTMSDRARRLIADYFERGRPGTLPDTLSRWIRRCDGLIARDGDLAAPRESLRASRDGAELSVRLLADGERRLLLLSERRMRLDAMALAPLGLSRRESEVLAWVVEGKTNGEIATILGAGGRTIEKHLERILRKLGVETRTAAASRVRELLRA
jgi:DNA-binding CsgD family transcriptional regulator